MPAITQLRGPRNRRAGPELWQVAYAWLGGQPIPKAPPAPVPKIGAKDRQQRLERIWLPFLELLPADAALALAAAVLPASRNRQSRSAPPASTAHAHA